MKGKLRILLSIILLLCISTLTVAGAQNFDDIRVFYNNIKVFVDNEAVSFNDEPFVYKDRVYVPIRFFAQALNTEVFWNRENNIVSINSYRDFAETNPLEGERFVYGEVLSINKEERIVHIYQHIDDNTVYDDKDLKISEDVIIILQRNSKKINIDFEDLKVGDVLGMVVNNENEVRGIIMNI